MAPPPFRRLAPYPSTQPTNNTALYPSISASMNLLPSHHGLPEPDTQDQLPTTYSSPVSHTLDAPVHMQPQTIRMRGPGYHPLSDDDEENYSNYALAHLPHEDSSTVLDSPHSSERSTPIARYTFRPPRAAMESPGKENIFPPPASSYGSFHPLDLHPISPSHALHRVRTSTGPPLSVQPSHVEKNEVHALMSDQQGGSTFPSLHSWRGFSPLPEPRTPTVQHESAQAPMHAQAISPRNTTHRFTPYPAHHQPLPPMSLAPVFTPSPPANWHFSNSNAYRTLVPPPHKDAILPPPPILPLPEPKYSENYSEGYREDVARAKRLLEDHMMNRWSGVEGAGRRLQEVCGTWVGEENEGEKEAAATLVGIKRGERWKVPEAALEADLMPGFGTPEGVRERSERGKSLRDVYVEYMSREGAEATIIASLSIHAVNGELGRGRTGLSNELLAHFDAANAGTEIQVCEIDLPSAPGNGKRIMFERWAVFALRVPTVCGLGCVDMGYIGSQDGGTMVFGAPVREIAVNGGRPTADVLADGTLCVRREYVFGPGVAHRLEFWEKKGTWAEVARRAVGEGAEWLCAEVDGVERAAMEKGEEDYFEGVMRGLMRNVERWRGVRGAMDEGACRVVTRVVGSGGFRREEMAQERRAQRAIEVGDWERDGFCEVEGGSSVKKRRM